MRFSSGARAIAIGLWFLEPSSAADTPLILIDQGKSWTVHLDRANKIRVGRMFPGETRVVPNEVSEVKLEPADDGLRVEWSGGEMRFRTGPSGTGREYKATVTYTCRRQVARRVGNSVVWRDAGVIPAKTFFMLLGVKLGELAPTIVAVDNVAFLALPRDISAKEASIQSSSIASIDADDPKRLVITGKKTGVTTYKVRYSLHGTRLDAEGRVEVVSRQIKIPVDSRIGKIVILTPKDVEKIASMKGKFLSITPPEDSKVCALQMVGDTLKLTPVGKGVTSAAAVFGEKKAKERIKVQLSITVRES